MKPKEREERTFAIELRVEGKEKRKITGYASVFNQWSEDLGGFREIVRPGAFKKTIKEADVRALFNHDPNYVLGRNKAGTLQLEEDDKGLKIDIDPPDTQWARDLTTSIERGDIDQMSFGFRTVKDSWGEEDDKNTRELLEVELFDVSPVTYPAYPTTVVGVRSVDISEMQRILLKSERNIPLTDKDKRILKENIEVMQQLTNEPDPVVHSGEPEEEPRNNSHSLRKRRLELAEREMQLGGLNED